MRNYGQHDDEVWKIDSVCLFVSNLIIKFAIYNIIIGHNMETKALTLDKYLFEDAQRYASRKGTDLTKLVEAYLKRLLKKEKKMEHEEIEIPDMVMSMLGVVPSDSIDADDINGRKAYHKHLEDRYNEKGLS